MAGRENCTVAILAQGTHWAVAVTQAFFAQARLPWLCDPVYSKNIQGLHFEISLGLLPSFFLSVFVCVVGSGPDRTGACPNKDATDWQGLVPSGKDGGGH